MRRGLGFSQFPRMGKEGFGGSSMRNSKTTSCCWGVLGRGIYLWWAYLHAGKLNWVSFARALVRTCARAYVLTRALRLLVRLARAPRASARACFCSRVSCAHTLNARAPALRTPRLVRHHIWAHTFWIKPIYLYDFVWVCSLGVGKCGVYLGEPKQLQRSYVIGEVLCHVIYIYIFRSTLMITRELCIFNFFWVCPTTPMSSAR